MIVNKPIVIDPLTTARAPKNNNKHCDDRVRDSSIDLNKKCTLLVLMEILNSFK